MIPNKCTMSLRKEDVIREGAGFSNNDATATKDGTITEL